MELSTFNNPSTPTTPESVLYAPKAAVFGFSYDDLEAAKCELESKGVEFLSEINIVVPESPLYAAGARKWVRIYTNEGAQIELIETV